jgi:hypothetical protein
MHSTDIVSAQAFQVKPDVACAMDVILANRIGNCQEHPESIAYLARHRSNQEKCNISALSSPT